MHGSNYMTQGQMQLCIAQRTPTWRPDCLPGSAGGQGILSRSATDLGPLDRANTLNPDTKTTHYAMTNQSKLHPGEFSRDIAKWHRGVIADIKQLTRGIQVYP